MSPPRTGLTWTCVHLLHWRSHAVPGMSCRLKQDCKRYKRQRFELEKPCGLDNVLWMGQTNGMLKTRWCKHLLRVTITHFGHAAPRCLGPRVMQILCDERLWLDHKGGQLLNVFRRRQILMHFLQRSAVHGISAAHHFTFWDVGDFDPQLPGWKAIHVRCQHSLFSATTTNLKTCLVTEIVFWNVELDHRCSKTI